MALTNRDTEGFQPVAAEHSAHGGLAGSGPVASPVDHVQEGPYTERCCAT